MANKKKSKAKGKTETILTMSNGKAYRVVSSEGRYYKCEATQFRKTNPDIVSVEEVCVADVEDELTKEEQ